MKAHFSRAVLSSSVVLLAVACGDPLVDPQTVTGLRILGAKLTATDDASKAEVEPGAEATLNWLVVAEKERDYHARSLFCKAEPGSFGVPRCGAEFLQQETEGSTAAPLVFPFTLPENFKDSQEWLSFLALCETGKARWNKNTQRFTCTSDDAPIVAFYHGAHHEEVNHNPNLQDDTLRIDGKDWSAPSEGAACDTDELPKLSSDETSTIQLTVKGSDSEDLDDPSYAAASKEALTYTHVATTAGLARAFSALDPDAKNTRIELELSGDEAWADAQKNQLGTFYLVVSDGRGGTDWLQRTYCVTK